MWGTAGCEASHTFISSLFPSFSWWVCVRGLFPGGLSLYNKQNTFPFVAVVQSLSRVRLFVTPWTAARLASLSFTIFQSLLKLMSLELVMPSNHLILCCPLLLLPSIFPSIRVFSNELALPIRWPKYWSFSFSINSSDEYSGLISFRIDWFVLLAVQGTLKGLLPAPQHLLQHSAFFMVQFSRPYMTTGKTVIPFQEFQKFCSIIASDWPILGHFPISEPVTGARSCSAPTGPP